MSLSYYYEFTAPAASPAGELEEFLRGVEQLAKSLGFAPTTVLNVLFDTRNAAISPVADYDPDARDRCTPHERRHPFFFDGVAQRATDASCAFPLVGVPTAPVRRPFRVVPAMRWP
jgi:hypothetical protein